MKEKLKKIGKIGTLRTQWGFYIQVKVLDYKHSYGKDRWLVEPEKGAGNAYVEAVEFDGDE